MTYKYILAHRETENGFTYNPGVYLYESDGEIAKRIAEMRNDWFVVLRTDTDREAEYERGDLRPDVVFCRQLGGLTPIEMVREIRMVTV